MLEVLAPMGRLGAIVPTGIATDDTTKDFFANCVGRHQLVSLSTFAIAASFLTSRELKAIGSVC